MRKLNLEETEILETVKIRTSNDAIAITKIVELLIEERRTGANSDEEMNRIDDLLEVRSYLSGVSIYIDNVI